MLLLLAALLAAVAPSFVPVVADPPPRTPSIAVGTPTDGSLRHGRRLHAGTPGLKTWDPILGRSPNRAWRRNGTDRLVTLLGKVAREHAAAHPDAPPLMVGDLSRPNGGDFGARYGIVGHASHQNGRDADVYYPRRDGRAMPPASLAGADLALSRGLVRRFLAEGAELVYVSPGLGLRGRRITPVGGHENHLHVRISRR